MSADINKLLARLTMSRDDRVEAVWFIENVFEVAFGDDAINKDFTYQEVLDKLDEFSSLSLQAGDVEDE
tara:strand:- start:192 stop:398 length:207 start_codon:yes stop_codon:yes gene_type:complete